MAVSPTPPPISILPPAPLPTDAEAVFDAKAGVRLTAEEVMVTEQNAALAWQATSMAETKGYKDAAATSATAAADSAILAGQKVGLAADQVALAVSAKDQAALSATSAQAYAQASGAAAGIPPAVANSVLLTDAAGNAFWGKTGLVRSARTSNTVLAPSDKGSFVDITGGTFTQMFAAVATLGPGWFCYIQNSGTGDITLDPNSAETIDGLASFVMYPGEVRIIQCDGTALRSIVLHGFTKVFTASGNFIKPPGYSLFGGLLWGAGGGGSASGGGGGGACMPIEVAASLIAASQSVTIASGGVAGTNGAVGGTSVFGSFSAFGGGGGDSAQFGGGGGGLLGGGIGGTGGTPNGSTGNADTDARNSSMGGGSGGYGGGSTIGGQSIYGGGGGGRTASGGKSIYGGGGGSGNASAGGTSAVGGNGGVSGSIGVAPAGGGGANAAGARGELRIWGVV